jgi:hypothetical protein
VPLNTTTLTNETPAASMLAYKAAMVADGWAVAISSDGTTYNGSGDQITTSGSGAGGIDNANAYFLLTRTGAPDWLFVRSYDSSAWVIWTSATGAFSGGNATTRPTAPDERILFDDSYALFQGIPLASVEVQVEDAAPYRWALWSLDTNDNRLFVAAVGATAARPLLLWGLPAIATGYFSAESDVGAWDDVVDLLSQPIGGGGGGGDATPPVVDISPTTGGDIERADAVVVTATDNVAVSAVTISAEYADGTVVTVWDGTAFVGAFATGSTQVGSTWTIEHDDPGWPSSSVAIHVLAVDSSGNTETASASYTVTDPPAAPVIADWTPAAVPVARGDGVEFTVTCPDGFDYITVSALLADGSTVVVYDGAAFGGQVDDDSATEGSTVRAFHVEYNGVGWTQNYTLQVKAKSALGPTASATQAYVLTDPPSADATPPTVTLLSHAPGDAIGANDAVRLRVTDPGGLKRVKLFVQMGDEQYVIHNGYSFRPRYAQGSTRSAVTNGYEFVLLRSGGWFAAPTFEVHATDLAGNER